MNKQLHVFFSGTVQGVGFRYTTQRIARQFRVAGFVKNLKDGRVELLAQGKEGILKDFLKEIQSSSVGPYIRDLDVSWQAIEQAQYESFSIAMS